MNEQDILELGFTLTNKTSKNRISFRNKENTMGVTLRKDFIKSGETDVHIYKLNENGIVKTYYQGYVENKETLLDIINNL